MRVNSLTYLLYTLLIIGGSFVFAQEDSIVNIQDSIVQYPDVEAQYPGGFGLLMNYIEENANYDIKDCEVDDLGRILFTFIISSTGKVSNVKIISKDATCLKLNEMYIKLFEEMPNWIPAQVEEKNVASRYIIPISIHLD